MSGRAFNLEGGTLNQPITQANSGASQVSAVNGSATYTNEFVYSGTLGAKMVTGSGQLAICRWTPNSNSATMSFGLPFAVPATPASTPTWFATMRYASGYVARFQWTSANTIQVTDTTGAGIMNILSNATPGGLYWLSAGVIVATSTTGYILAEIYDWQGNLLGSQTSSAYNLGTAAVSGADTGIVNNTATTGTVVYFDQPQFNDGSSKGIKPPTRFAAAVGLGASGALTLTPTTASSVPVPLTGAGDLTATPQQASSIPVPLGAEGRLDTTTAQSVATQVALAASSDLSTAATLSSTVTAALQADATLDTVTAHHLTAASPMTQQTTIDVAPALSSSTLAPLDALGQLSVQARLDLAAMALLDAQATLTITPTFHEAPIGEPHDLELVGSIDQSSWAGSLDDAGYSGALDTSGWSGTL